jgi:thiamine biosynthesis lipoprotein
VTLHELAFPSMGTRVRLLASDASQLPAARAEVERLAAALTRFDDASELCALNADPRRVVPASADLCAAVAAALDGARLTRGLADPTLLGPLERAGYRRSLTACTPVTAALRAAPARRPAEPDRTARWRDVRVRGGAIDRPPGVRLDLGGSAKGFIADRVAALLDGPCAVDCGGDIRVRGTHAVHVRHPLTGAIAAILDVDGAVATSGIDARTWGAATHHLIDPSTNRPAWTGAVTATAVAPTAAEAEARAKAALLAGPDGGREWLREHGGVIVAEDGEVWRTAPRSRGPGLRLVARRNGAAPAFTVVGSVPNGVAA